HRKAAAAVGGGGRETLLAITRHDVADRAAHQIYGRSRIGPIGHHVAGANDAIGRDAKPRRLGQQGLRRLEVAVRPPEQHQGVVESKQGGWSVHHAFSIRPVAALGRGPSRYKVAAEYACWSGRVVLFGDRRASVRHPGITGFVQLLLWPD